MSEFKVTWIKSDMKIAHFIDTRKIATVTFNASELTPDFWIDPESIAKNTWVNQGEMYLCIGAEYAKIGNEHANLLVPRAKIVGLFLTILRMIVTRKSEPQPARYTVNIVWINKDIGNFSFQISDNSKNILGEVTCRIPSEYLHKWDSHGDTPLYLTMLGVPIEVRLSPNKGKSNLMVGLFTFPLDVKETEAFVSLLKVKSR